MFEPSPVPPETGVILIVDDTPANLSLLAELLTAQGHEVRVAPGGVLALQSARANPPDLVLLDIRMPDMDGYEVCRQFKSDERMRDIPVIFLSALDASQDKLGGFQAGGVDYITKPFEGQEVLARVSTHLRLKSLQNALQEKNQELEKANLALQNLAMTDPLTGLPNRRALLEQAELCQNCSRRYNAPYSLILFDIDHFKSINDRHGHDVGDRVLRALSGIVQTTLRETDLLARWGGEEFMILVPLLSREETCLMAERIRNAIALANIDPLVGQITASFGVAGSQDGDSLDAVIKTADEALYEAKRAGRNQVKCSGAIN